MTDRIDSPSSLSERIRHLEMENKKLKAKPFDNSLALKISALEREVGLLKMESKDGYWADWTPTWTAYEGTPSLGNGTIIGKYFRLGKMVIINVALNFGSTTSAAGTTTWYISLPIQSAGLGHGVWVALESGVKFYYGVIEVTTGATTMVGFYAPDGQGFLSETRPHTWKANDYLTFTAIYQVA